MYKTFPIYLVILAAVTVLNFKLCQCESSFKTLAPVKSYVKANTQTKAVQALIYRVLGDRSSEVIVEVQPSSESKDHAYIHNYLDKLKITGTSGVAVAFAFNKYLKYYCRKQISWAGDQLEHIPHPLPHVPVTGWSIKAGVKYRYYQNVCTVSYSSVWWNWTRWEREIDWMALNGINLPLAFTGQEAIWQRVYKQLGCTDKDLDEHFAGPAFLAWGRMGNIHGFGGPLPQSWKESQLALQHKILERMRSLGMIPVLPGFAGHVPAAITRLYPDAEVSKLSSWSHFNCTYSCTILLEPHDPLFRQIGSMFIEEQMKEYNGTNHIYNADTFNEMIPRSSDVGYLANASNAVYEAMAKTDPDAIWLMQGWLFHSAPYFWKSPQIKALVTAVPQGRMLILDLFSEAFPQYPRTYDYYGQPFIWCMLHDFGGNLGFYGKIEIVNQSPYATLHANNSTMVGTGITPEGINQNYIMYDLMLEVGYSVQPENLTFWLVEYAMRRYNADNVDAIKTWLTLGSSIYNDTSIGFPAKSLIRGSLVKRPSLTTTELPYWYQRSSLRSAWDSFATALDNLEDIETVRYDSVDITRQMLQAIHRSIYYNMVQEYKQKNLSNVEQMGSYMLDLLKDFDRILSTDKHFMMGCWIADARALGTNDNEKDLYEYNARNQVTLWGPDGEIMDYADKHWASLTLNYYWPRWAMFIYHLEQALVYDVAFNSTAYNSNVFRNIEEPFTKDKTVFPTVPKEHPITVAKEIYLKWKDMLQ
ncbi:alpha-N-acetylglucosaminidase-like [Clavelina lepadiformis]|uniref:Alpha-N-acetylglucosaminidase n=1 Tax=Clavelina lepadiformis TaxID=159417 RepID=A0ABP0GCU8_CLALP